MKEIYVVTTIKFGMKEIPVGPRKGKPIFGILDRRPVGWYQKKEDAVDCIEKNRGDIYECGSYPYAVIEEVTEGLYPICEKSWWFKWDKKYRPSKKPVQYKRVFNYAIG